MRDSFAAHPSAAPEIQGALLSDRIEITPWEIGAAKVEDEGDPSEGR